MPRKLYRTFQSLQRLLCKSLTVLSCKVAPILPAGVSVSVLGALSSLSNWNCSFSAHSSKLTSIELLSCTNNQPPVWMKAPDSFLAKLPSPVSVLLSKCFRSRNKFRKRNSIVWEYICMYIKMICYTCVFIHHHVYIFIINA